jgi:ribonuclease J
MKIKIHKGTNEIGGSCIELKTKNTTILVDYGTPLQDTSKQVKITDNIDAILISHPHQDHFGEIVNIENTTPIYCGELSIELMNAAKIFTGNEILENNFQIFEAWKSFEIGDFKITPYLVDHSATDAYAFLIEADSKKVLYSGDFRANGRKSKLFDRMIKDKDLQNVDILLMEGTMLQRSNKDFPDEQSVEDKISETIKEKNLISFMIGSSQNIDSIVSAYRACKKANKIFVVDMYTAWILEKMKIISSSIPNIDWGDVKVIKKFGGSYYQKLQENKEYFKGFTSKVFDNVVEIDDIKANPQNYFLKISPWHIQKVLNYIEVDTSNIIYSQWLGYLKEEFSNIDTVELFKDLKENNNWIYAHTSGHADLPALQKFASSLEPKKLIPIHTEFKGKFAEHFENVMILEDGESFDINGILSVHQVNELNQLFKDDFFADDNNAIKLLQTVVK